MSQVCTVCKHQDQASIDRMLIDGTPLRRIAEQSGTSVTALHRHKEHVPVALAAAKGAEKAADAQSLLEQVQELLARARRLTDKAEHAKDLRGALSGVRAIGSVLELLGKVSGQLTPTSVEDAHAHKVNAEAVREKLIMLLGGKQLQEEKQGLSCLRERSPIEISLCAAAAHAGLGKGLSVPTGS